MRRRSPLWFLTAALGSIFFFTPNIAAQAVGARDRITAAVDGQRTVRLAGNRHPLARSEFAVGKAAPDHRMERMILALQPDPAQSGALEALIAAQHDSTSPQYRQWLTPEAFAGRFGVSENDADRIVQWLTAAGFKVEEIPAGRRSIVFSGTAAQVEAAFHTPILAYRVGGELHYANAADPEMPEALAGVVAGTVTLHDFRRRPLHLLLNGLSESAPQFTSGSSHYLAPADFAKIYDVAALYSASIDGTGQTIAIVGRSNILMSDIQAFRNRFGLVANNPAIVLNGPDPGIVSAGEEMEADLDVQWSGAVAPKAAIKLVVSASTSASDGVDLSAQYIVSHNLAPVMSTSFGNCETFMGAAERGFYNSLWQQAAAQGITALISSDDSGAAGCDPASASKASYGRAVNGLCSTPYSVCVGGTEFNEAGNPGLYWSAGSNATTLASALSYIPEVAWNESGSYGGSGLWASGGGASAYYPKPTWQTGPGVPTDGMRDVPDVSLSAAGHDGYLVFSQGSLWAVGGTSASSPSFAGLMALVNQKTGARQGNANTALYAIARNQAQGGAGVFHDITGGNNTVPGVSGFNAGAQYDQATGLGSVDAFVLVNHWGDTAPVPATLTLTVAPTSIPVPRGGGNTATASLAGGGGFNSTVALSVTGLPAGVTAKFASASLAAPGSGTDVLTVSATATAVIGTYPLTVTAAGGGLTKTATLALAIGPAPGFTLGATPTSLTLAPGASGSTQIGATSIGGFTAALTLAAGTLPAGVTVQFSASSIHPGASTAMTVKTTAGVVPGSYQITVSGTAAGVTPAPAVVVTLNVSGFKLTAPQSASIPRQKNAAIPVQTTVINGFNAALTLSVTGLPAGVTASFSPAAITNPASGASTLSLSASSGASAGAHTITVTASGGGVSQSVPVSLTVAAK